MSSIQYTSDIVNSNTLNKETDISCKNQDGSGGRILSGFKYGRDDTGYKIELAKCSSVKIDENIFGLQKGTEFSKTCDCEMVEAQNGSVTCPNEKFLNTYYPLLKKGSCCKPCNNEGKIKVSVDEKNCFPVVKSESDNDASCPDKLFMKNINFTNGTAKIECCAAKFEGDIVEKQNVANDECSKMKIPKELCSNEFMNTLKNKCKEYGIADCNYDAVRNIESKCNSYGMRYFDTLENKYKNTDSSMNCHADNFLKLDNQCTKNNVNSCSVYNLRDSQSNDVQSLKKDISNIDTIQNAYDKKFDEMGNSVIGNFFGNKMLVAIMFVLCIVLISTIVYFIVKKPTKN